MPEPSKRARILARLGEVLGQRCQRNRQTEITKADLPLVVLYDGEESLAPAANARPGRRLLRWQMSPEIDVYLPVAVGEIGAAALDAWLAGLLPALEQDAELRRLLTAEQIAGADFTPVFPQNAPGMACGVLTLHLLYDK